MEKRATGFTRTVKELPVDGSSTVCTMPWGVPAARSAYGGELVVPREEESCPQLEQPGGKYISVHATGGRGGARRKRHRTRLEPPSPNRPL